MHVVECLKSLPPIIWTTLWVFGRLWTLGE